MGNGLCACKGSSSRPISPSSSQDRPTQTAAGRTATGASAVPTSSSGASPSTNPPAKSAAEEGREGSGAGADPCSSAGAGSAAGSPGGARVPLMATTPGDRKAAEELKAEGNALFARGKYAAAIEKYTEAITLCPDWAVLYVNRGMAARKRSPPEWGRVEADAAAALALGPGVRDAMKGHYLLGLATGATGQHERSTHHLRKALDAAREANDAIKDEIWRELATANYQHWQAESGARKAAHAALRQQLADLLRAGGQQGPAPAPAGPHPHHTHTHAHSHSATPHHPPAGPPLPAPWAALFAAAAAQDTPKEAPSQFTCPLTMEIFRDPVITPSGRSYERSALLEHLKKVGRFDPITRSLLTEESLVPNVSLRAAIEVYLEEHPWAWGEVK